jgi:hypothetical protein
VCAEDGATQKPEKGFSECGQPTAAIAALALIIWIFIL